MRATRLIIMGLALIVLVNAAATVRSVEPLNGADAVESPLVMADQPVQAQNDLSNARSLPSEPLAAQASNLWQVDCVDCPKWFGSMTESSLQLDAAGHPHVAYGKDCLYYAWHDGAQWHYETVDSGALVGDYTSLALDQAGHPHISYRHCGFYGHSPYDYCTIDDLKYAWYDGSKWHTEVVDINGGSASLAVDQAGQPHISYSGRDGLQYGWRDESGWHIETADSTYSGFTSLALDDNDHPHISYYDWENESLKYAWYDGTNWQIETLDVYAGWCPAIALDGQGRPHIIYYDLDNNELKYARHDGEDWQIETVFQLGMRSSLALDSLGQPHISYRDNAADGLKYAWYDGADWQVEMVPMDSDGHVGWHSSLALDGEDQPHIVHLDHLSYPANYPYLCQDNDDLLYTWHDETGWHTHQLDSEGNVGDYSSLTLDAQDRPHIGYYDVNHPGLKYAWYDGADWQVERVASASSANIGLALDSEDRPHLSYGHHARLKYAWHDGGDWQIEELDSPGCGDTSLALDEQGRPHISYQGQDRLKYAWHDGTSWQIETVDDDNDVGADNSLALDQAGRPHISYYDERHWDLKHAWHDGDNWQIEIVDGYPDQNVGERSSLALDAQGRPHISYRGSGLQYAWHDGENWQIETAVPSGGGYSSLALDGDGRPHISFYRASQVAYAWHDGTQWLTMTIDSQQYGGWYTSLALDSSGRPHVSYYAGYLIGDLKHARFDPPTLSLSKQATPDEGVAYGDMFTYTLTLSGPGLNVRLWDPLPPQVQYVSGGLTGSLRLPAVYSPTAHAVLWQGQLPTETASSVQFQVSPIMMGTGSLSLRLPIVNTAWLTSLDSSQTVSATVIVNAFRVYLPSVVRRSD